MEDKELLALLRARDESALRIMDRQYGTACRSYARHLLGSAADADEAFNDALLHLWNAIPPAEPENLYAYLCTTVRRICLDMLERRNAKKRGGGVSELPLHAEIAVNAPSDSDVNDIFDSMMLTEAINRFLRTLSADARTIFIARYGSDRTVSEIAEAFCIGKSKVTVSLMRTKRKLWRYLKEEGWL